MTSGLIATVNCIVGEGESGRRKEGGRDWRRCGLISGASDGLGNVSAGYVSWRLCGRMFCSVFAFASSTAESYTAYSCVPLFMSYLFRYV